MGTTTQLPAQDAKPPIPDQKPTTLRQLMLKLCTQLEFPFSSDCEAASDAATSRLSSDAPEFQPDASAGPQLVLA